MGGGGDGVGGVGWKMVKRMGGWVKVDKEWIGEGGMGMVDVGGFVLDGGGLVRGMWEWEMWMGSWSVVGEGGGCWWVRDGGV